MADFLPIGGLLSHNYYTIPSRKSAILLAFFLPCFLFTYGKVEFLTYYSKQVYIKNLPVVDVAMPEMADKLDNGRYAYSIPAKALRRDEKTGLYFVIILKEVSDVLGDNYYPQITTITLLSMDADTALIDGLVYVEPVILSDDERVENGSRVKLKDE